MKRRTNQLTQTSHKLKPAICTSCARRAGKNRWLLYIAGVPPKTQHWETTLYRFVKVSDDTYLTQTLVSCITSKEHNHQTLPMADHMWLGNPGPFSCFLHSVVNTITLGSHVTTDTISSFVYCGTKVKAYGHADCHYH